MNEEQKIKQEMHQRELPDSFEMTFGTPSKGSQVCLKVYYDALNIDEAQAKVDNILKIREYLIKKGIIV